MSVSQHPRIFAISDIHGHEDGLLLLLDAAGYKAGVDRLMLLGDYVNEEPDSWDTLRTIKTLANEGAVALPGNTDLTVAGLSEAPARLLPLLSWLKSLPSYWIEGDYLFVHAGIRPGVPLERQSLRDLTEIREAFWTERPSVPYTVIFGHTPTYKLGAEAGRIWCKDRRIGIDTGAKHGQRLTLLDVAGRRTYSCSTSPLNLYRDIRTDFVYNFGR
ncbi:metallophosphoesterase [Cohnella hongkongensis]|uniref:Metallophosphoesterase n=1 Tax=Cohnella hongkongensis TaxID=178337 RepID=A0ABV9FHN7_9BACL